MKPENSLKELKEAIQSLAALVERLELEQNSAENKLSTGDKVEILNSPRIQGTVVKINKFFIDVVTEKGILRRSRKNIKKL